MEYKKTYLEDVEEKTTLEICKEISKFIDKELSEEENKLYSAMERYFGLIKLKDGSWAEIQVKLEKDKDCWGRA